MKYFENTHYIIFDYSEIDKINFDFILEDSINTLRLSVDKTKTFIGWFGDISPEFIQNITTKSKIYSYEEILSILATSEWIPNFFIN
jgi:hypothetical protein